MTELTARCHREHTRFKDTRTVILVFASMVDLTVENGATKVVPGSHLWAEQSSLEFSVQFAHDILLPAGHVCIVDGALVHRAGTNSVGLPRPMLQLNCTLAFMKQQFNPWGTDVFEGAAPRVKARLGYNVRSYTDPDEIVRAAGARKWTSGNYDTTAGRLA